ncbi:MAG: ABC transporter ATP-binding protein [Roseburia sp.]|nr:ABC transporter ATP-binding protein [Roseburia sp.]MCM1241847.1 ABC transporter ATP-binding protein [Roseburia sp.]
MSEKIVLKDVRQRFGEKEVLKGVSFTIGAGEIFGLLGPSGAGKTTIIKIITGQLKPTGGSAMTDGKEAAKISGTMYKKMGMMLDNYGLYGRLSCYDNLKLFTRIYDIPPGRINEVLAKVGLAEEGKTPAEKLSKGMRGRLVLARAIINKPEILFLDEPTSGLDPSTTRRIHELILEEQKRGATIFLTTHNMAEAEKLCGHVALLHEGTIVKYGEPKEICRKYNHQNKLQIRLYDGTCMEIGNDSKAAETVRDYLAAGSIETIHSTEPNLETVFMELTGKGLE